MTSESAIQNLVRRDFAFIGPIWRNQVGAMIDETGRVVRFGLANDSAQLNKHIKSSDLIGITPVLVTPALYGVTLGVFTALECKPSAWRFSPSDERASAQLKFHDIVRQHGGFAGFVNDPKQIHEIIRRG